jgi:hypothetical protein
MESISKGLDSAREIDFSYNSISLEGVKAFVRSTYKEVEDVCRIEILNFEGNNLGDQASSIIF